MEDDTQQPPRAVARAGKDVLTMGIIYELSDGIWAVEAREKSIRIFKDLPDDSNIDEDVDVEMNYEDLDGFQAAVEFAQRKRRDEGG